MDSLKSKKEFDFVYKHGFSRYGRSFTLYVCKMPSDFSPLVAYPQARLRQMKQRAQPSQLSPNPSRLGLSVSRKVGNAVVRNLIKRRVRMLCREYKQIAYGFCVVFVAKPGIADMSFAQLQESFCKTLAFTLQHLGKKPLHTKHQSSGKARERSKESSTRATGTKALQSVRQNSWQIHASTLDKQAHLDSVM